jgi:hypothetical protein
MKLVTQLLSSAQVHLPSLGFTVEAIEAGAKRSGIASSSTVAGLFPSPSNTAASLLERFDQRHWETLSSLRGEERLRLSTGDEQATAYFDAVKLLEDKLVATIPVKEKLPDVSWS